MTEKSLLTRVDSTRRGDPPRGATACQRCERNRQRRLATSASGVSCKQFAVCAIEPARDADREACLNDVNTSAHGWCLLDPGNGLGNEALLAGCYEGGVQRLRFVGDAEPRPGSRIALACKRTQ